MAKILFSGILLLLIATASFAQDYGVAYATTAIDWDEGANILHASCTIQLDYVAQAYYQTATNCYIYHDENVPAHIVANNWGYGGNYAAVNLEYDYPAPNDQYSTQGTYFVTMPYYYQDSGYTYYYDPDYYLYYNGAGIDAPLWYDFDGFNNSEYVQGYDTLFLGYLYSSLATAPGPPTKVKVVTDNLGYPQQCQATGIYLRQMQMQLVDDSNVAINTNASIVESYDQRPTNTCTNQQIPPPSGCAATGDGGTGQFLDTMLVAIDVCNSGIPHDSSCGYTLTSTWSVCNGASNPLWASERVTHANGISVGGNTTGYQPGTVFNHP